MIGRQTRHRRGRWILICLALALISVSPADAQDAQAPSAPVIYQLSLDASINPATADYLLRAVDRAEADNARLLLVQLDTPGGLVTSTREIVDRFLNAEVPIAVWVGPAGAWAASAGTFITMSANVAAMAEGTSIGAAHPVNIGGGSNGDGNDGEGETDPQTEKTVNFLAQWAREIASARDRNADWAELAVRQSVTAGAETAQAENIIDRIAASSDALLAQLDGAHLADGRTLQTSDARVESLSMSWRETLRNQLSDPNIVYVLLLVGLFAFVLEILSAGIGLGLIVGGLSLALAILGLNVLPVNLVGIVLLGFGMALMIGDVFYAQTNGILTGGGVIALAIGSVTLFDFQDIEQPALNLNWWVIVLTIGTISGLFGLVVVKGIFSQREQPDLGAQQLLGSIGFVTRPPETDQDGLATVEGEYWRIRSDDVLHSDDEIEVTDMKEGRLIVRRTETS